jgi:hypothetical protein
VNDETLDHFYTTSESERDGAISELAYRSEDVAAYVFDSEQGGTVPLFRLVGVSS